MVICCFFNAGCIVMDLVVNVISARCLNQNYRIMWKYGVHHYIKWMLINSDLLRLGRFWSSVFNTVTAFQYSIFNFSGFSNFLNISEICACSQSTNIDRIFLFCRYLLRHTTLQMIGRSTSARQGRSTTTIAEQKCPSGRSPKSGWRGMRTCLQIAPVWRPTGSQPSSVVLVFGLFAALVCDHGSCDHELLLGLGSNMQWSATTSACFRRTA